MHLKKLRQSKSSAKRETSETRSPRDLVVVALWSEEGLRRSRVVQGGGGEVCQRGELELKLWSYRSCVRDHAIVASLSWPSELTGRSWSVAVELVCAWR